MSNENLKQDTEMVIKKTAKELFFAMGHFKATTQEIADAAGVNRTAINYYFRSRDNLFDIVFKEALQQINENQKAIIELNIPFREKLEKWLDDELASALKYPFLEIYVVTELQNNIYHKIKDESFMAQVSDILKKELEAEIKKGTIKPIKPIHFILNIGSMVSFPTCMRPLLQKTLKLNDKEFDRIIRERKQVILDTIFIK